MRIAIVAEVFLPKVDGVVMRTMRLLEELAKSGDEVTVFCPEAPDCEHDTVRTIPSPSFSCVAYPEYQIGIPSMRMVDQLQQFRPDVVHFINPFAFGFQCYNLLQREHLAVPTVFSFHTLYGEFVKQYPVLNALSLPIWSLTRAYHNCATVNLTVSSILQEQLGSRGFHRVRTWPPAVDTDRFRPDRGTAGMRSLLSDGEVEKPLLLTVSRLAPEKNVAFLADVLANYPDARIAIVGDGPDRSRLEKLFPRNRTVFTGYLRGERLAEAYSSADLFVYASETETMGNVIMEAMSSGLPTIAPRAGGIPSLIRSEESGILYEPSNLESARSAIDRLLGDATLRENLKVNARESVLQCGWQRSIETVRDCYKEAINIFETDPMPMKRVPLRSRLAVSSLVRVFRGLEQTRLTSQKVQRRLAPSS